MTSLKLLLLIILIPMMSLAKTHKVKMLSKSNGQTMIFEPSFLKINSGDKVTFIPSNSGHSSQSVFIPKGAESWEGTTSTEISVTLHKEGLYIYKCRNHFVMGMNGIIQVGKATNLAEAKSFVKDYKKKIAINKERLDYYLEKIRP